MSKHPWRASTPTLALLLNVIPFGVDDDSWVAVWPGSTVQRLGYALSLQVTGGSSSIRDAWEPLRLAGATARAMLIQAAANQWQVKPQTCVADNGRVTHTASGRALRYAELAEAAAKLPVPDDVPFKDPTNYKLIGKPVRRLDIPAKTNGQAQFGIDVKVEGMVYAALAQPPGVRRQCEIVRRQRRQQHARRAQVSADSRWRGRGGQQLVARPPGSGSGQDRIHRHRARSAQLSRHSQAV